MDFVDVKNSHMERSTDESLVFDASRLRPQQQKNFKLLCQLMMKEYKLANVQTKYILQVRGEWKHDTWVSVFRLYVKKSEY